MSFTALTLAIVGFVLGSIGALGAELLNRFIGRSLEAYCRLRGKRERYGEVLDQHEDAARAAEYLRIIGTVMFLTCGTLHLITASDAQSDRQSLGFSIIPWLVVATVTVMFTHLWAPAAITRFASAPVLYRTWPCWRGLSYLMRPLSIPGVIVSLVAQRIAGQTESDNDEEALLEDEIRTIVAAGTREGHFKPGVREMIQGVMDLHDDAVRHIMTPRSDVDAIEIETPWPEVLRIVANSGRTRLPVYRETLDDIQGVLYVKDLLVELSASEAPQVPLSRLLRKPWTVPGSRRVDELLQEFLHSRSHMAIVVDEFRQVAGVVTIEDALEEIVGEIVDESDDEEQAEFTVVDDSTALVSGRVMVDEINERLGWELPESEDYETIAGYVLHTLGYIPKQNESFVIGPLAIRILKASTRQIERMHVHHQSATLEAG